MRTSKYIGMRDGEWICTHVVGEKEGEKASIEAWNKRIGEQE